jgi:hypothetical protein
VNIRNILSSIYITLLTLSFEETITNFHWKEHLLLPLLIHHAPHCAENMNVSTYRGINVTRVNNVICPQNHETNENKVCCIFICFVILRANYINSTNHNNSSVREYLKVTVTPLELITTNKSSYSYKPIAIIRINVVPTLVDTIVYISALKSYKHHQCHPIQKNGSVNKLITLKIGQNYLFLGIHMYAKIIII